jgi:predicted AlkP superfamily pyrophosphatase or phosphodiesterase
MVTMNKNIACIFIDALRPDFISEKHTPFLYKLSKDNPLMEIETILGYSDAIDATIFTGVHPDIHGYWMRYWYDPVNSPFKNAAFLKIFRTIDFIPSAFIRSGINYVLYYTFYKWLSKKLGYNELASFNIPYKLLQNFGISLKKSLLDKNPFEGIPTLFDVLRQNNKSFYYTHGIKPDTLKSLGEVDLGIVYFSDIDASAHLFGTDNFIFSRTLRKLDNKVETIFKKVKEKNPNATIIIFSDHGMAKVNKILDFKNLLKQNNLRNHYLVALDATMIRFWYFDEAGKIEIRNWLKDKQYGHFLTGKEISNLRINFKHNKWGDDIFLLDQGYSIFPNFMSWAKPKAMHAYHPKYKEQRGTFIIHGISCRDIDEIKLVDIMPTILDIFGLQIPNNVEGKSIVR